MASNKKVGENKPHLKLNSNLLEVFSAMYVIYSPCMQHVYTRMGTFITYCLAQQKLNISRYMMTLWKDRIAWKSLILLRSRVEVYLLNEVKLGREVLTQKVIFNPAPQKIEALLHNSAFPELHHIPRYV